MDCIYCTSQPLEGGPCECSHAPCIHDRNSTIENHNKTITALMDHIKKLQTELREMRSSILDSIFPGSRGFDQLLRANTLAHIEKLIEDCDIELNNATIKIK